MLFLIGVTLMAVGSGLTTVKGQLCTLKNIQAVPCYFNQTLNHYDRKSQTFLQRIWSNSTYVDPDMTNPPIFFLLGGENNMDGMFDGAAWADIYAKDYGAHMLIAEHRYYGQSLPIDYANGDSSKSTMQFLTSSQAVLDYRAFLKAFKAANPKFQNSKTVIFGGSYSGGLAVLFRMSFPNLVQVAVASSAPISFKFEFPEYVGTASRVIKETDRTCYDDIKEAFQCFKDLLDGNDCDGTSATKDDLANRLYYTCDNNYDLTPRHRQEPFFRGMAYFWTTNNPATHAQKFCPSLIKEFEKTTDIVDAYGNFLLANNATSSGVCGSRRKGQRLQLAQRRPAFGDESEVDQRSWDWQTCNEYGDFQVSDNVTNLFAGSWSTNIDTRYCRRTFSDASFTPLNIRTNILRTNALFNFKKPRTTCVVYVSGSDDPWGPLGITRPGDLVTGNQLVFIQKGQHWNDLWIPYEGSYNYDNIIEGITSVNHEIGVYLEGSC